MKAAFTKHTIDPEGPTCFYMFSDGYADQFGGTENGKFMVKRMQDLFVEIYKKPMETQKEILDSTIEKWMDGQEQIDDILVVGFKMG